MRYGIQKADLITIGACRLQVAAMTRVGQVDILTTPLSHSSPVSPFPSTHSLVLICCYGREAGLREDERAKVARMLVLIQRGILRRQIDQVKARLVAMHGVQYDLWKGEE